MKTKSTLTCSGAPARVVTLIAASLLLPVFTDPAAAEATGAGRKLHGTATITFYGTSTLHDFSGMVPAQPFVLTLASNRWSAEAKVLTKEMSTANAKRDLKMWDMFAATKFPNIQGQVTDAPRAVSGETNATLHLRIRKTEHDLPVEISQWTEGAGGVRFHARWDVSLKAYGLKPPSVLGLIRVGDRVRVEADVVASPPASSAVTGNHDSAESESKP